MKKAVQSGTTLVYHDCCISFSRKGFAKKSKHPPEMSVSVHRLPDFKLCKDEEELFEWMIKKIKSRSTVGLPPFFPTVNCYHSTFKLSAQPDEFESPSYLVKRYKEMEEEVVRCSFRSTTSSKKTENC